MDTRGLRLSQSTGESVYGSEESLTPASGSPSTLEAGSTDALHVALPEPRPRLPADTDLHAPAPGQRRAARERLAAPFAQTAFSIAARSTPAHVEARPSDRIERVRRRSASRTAFRAGSSAENAPEIRVPKDPVWQIEVRPVEQVEDLHRNSSWRPLVPGIHVLASAKSTFA